MRIVESFRNPLEQEPNISPWSEQVWQILEEADVDENLIQKVDEIIDDLANKYLYERDKECDECAKRQSEEEADIYKLEG